MREALTLSANADSSTNMMKSPIFKLFALLFTSYPIFTLFGLLDTFWHYQYTYLKKITCHVVKIVVTFEPIMQFCSPYKFRILKTIPNHQFDDKRQKL